MSLRYRRFHPHDIPACARLMEPYVEYSPDALSDLPTFWRRLYHDQAMVAAVIETYEANGDGKVVAFGADVFVTEEFAEETRDAREPCLSERLVRLELHGGPTPILRQKDIARANATTGVNIIIMHAAASKSEPEGLTQAIRFNIREAFLWAHRGYQINEIMQEVWDESDREWVRVWGSLRGDYAEFYNTRGLCIPRCRPYLVGLNRQEALANPGSLGAPLFLYGRPRFHLSQGSQELISAALEGDTDVELAEKLHISLPAVKLRWRVIYDQVESIAPEILPDGIARATEGSRGKERRRCIIEYARNHPEELRPFLHPKRVCARGAARSPNCRTTQL
jgi:hypothetical protein